MVPLRAGTQQLGSAADWPPGVMAARVLFRRVRLFAPHTKGLPPFLSNGAFRGGLPLKPRILLAYEVVRLPCSSRCPGGGLHVGQRTAEQDGLTRAAVQGPVSTWSAASHCLSPASLGLANKACSERVKCI